jgi:hypothetical protein
MHADIDPDWPAVATFTAVSDAAVDGASEVLGWEISSKPASIRTVRYVDGEPASPFQEPAE